MNLNNNLGIKAEDIQLRMDTNIELKQLKPFTFPPEDLLKKINLRSVCLGSYIPWDVKEQSKIIQDKLGWKGDEVENVPPQYNYEKIECYMQGVRDYIKFIKRGYSRPSHLVALDLRNGRISTEQAKKEVEEYEGKKPPSLKLFLDFIGLTEEEFYEVAQSHQISPFKFDKSTNRITETHKTKDFEKWSKDGIANRDESLKEFEKWKKEQIFFK